MRILVLINDDEGLFKFRNELLMELINSNRVYISAPKGKYIPIMVEEGCVFYETPIDRRGLNPINDFRLLLLYRRILKKVKPHFVITYTVKPNIYGGFLCRYYGISYVTNITGLGTVFQSKSILQLLVVKMYKCAVKKAKVLFFENIEDKNVFVSHEIVKKERAIVLNGAGVNIEHYCVLEYPKTNQTVFIFIGRVMKEKGIDELLEAMKRLCQSGERVVLKVLGIFEEDYKEKFNKAEREGWLEYYGEQQDIRPFVKESHCFVLPSWHEGMANTNLECASMGRPVITSNIHGCLEAVENGVSGFLCEKQNADDLYEKMKKFISLSYEERKAMGLAGRKRMEEIFDKRKVVKETIDRLFDE